VCLGSRNQVFPPTGTLERCGTARPRHRRPFGRASVLKNLVSAQCQQKVCAPFFIASLIRVNGSSRYSPLVILAVRLSQGEKERRAASQFALGRDMPPVAADDALHGRQADAGAFKFLV